MSLLKGIQSAIFYYLSCAPCAQLAHKKRRRKQAQLDRRERDILEIEQPGLYRHPSPFATNPFWAEEIALGPGPPPRRSKKKAKDSMSRGIRSAGTQSTTGSASNSDGDTDALEKLGHADRRHSLNPKHWNFRRYQREDEALWGQSFDRESAASMDGSTRALPGSNTDSRYSRTETMYIARNPPINDLHPPVVSTPSSNVNETRWMLQPPPPAKIMSGKERANSNRSRSSTTASRNGSQLKIPQTKRANTSEELISADGTPLSKPLSRDPSFNNSLNRTPSNANRNRRRPDPISILNNSPHFNATAIQGPLRNANEPIDVADFANLPHALVPFTAARRSTKRLSTIISSESGAPASQLPPAADPYHHKENTPAGASSSEESIASAPSSTSSSSTSSPSSSADTTTGPTTTTGDDGTRQAQQQPLVVSDSSLRLLEELVSPAALLDSRFVKAPAVEARISLPAASAAEEAQLVGKPSGGMAWEDVLGWEAKRKDSGMVEVPREVRTRWSMDI
ncbi:MAG: hypothetical protein M1821_003460 [Bathelium mastoideum]|nr:MAG: hypothetical protein M1821_003460 [Bathelium mastoideum]